MYARCLVRSVSRGRVRPIGGGITRLGERKATHDIKECGVGLSDLSSLCSRTGQKVGRRAGLPEWLRQRRLKPQQLPLTDLNVCQRAPVHPSGILPIPGTFRALATRGGRLA